MKMSDQSPWLGASEVNLVVRHLKLEKVSDGAMAKIVKEIDKVSGLNSVPYEEKLQILHHTYDASRLNISGF